MYIVYRYFWCLFCKVWALLLLLREKCNKGKTLYNLCTDPFTYTLVIQRMKWLKSCPIKMCFLNNYGGRIKTEIGNKRTNILYCITFYVRQFWMRKIIPSFHSCYLLCMHFICQMARCIMFLFMRTYYIIFYFSLHCMQFINVHFIVLPSQYAIDLGNDFVIFILLPISSYLVLLFQGACCSLLVLFSTLNIVRYDWDTFNNTWCLCMICFINVTN